MRSQSQEADAGPITIDRMRPTIAKATDKVAERRSLSDADREELYMAAEADVEKGLGKYEYKSPQEERGWIYRVVFRCAWRWIHQRESVLYPAELKEAYVLETPTAYEQLVARERTAELRALLVRLSAQDRELFIEYHVKRTPSHELAKRLGCSPAAVRKRAERARNFLRGLAAGESFLA